MDIYILYDQNNILMLSKFPIKIQNQFIFSNLEHLRVFIFTLNAQDHRPMFPTLLNCCVREQKSTSMLDFMK